MIQPARQEITQLLEIVGRGDPSARERLFQLVYVELHRLAQAHMGQERAGHTLQPTALVHEVYLRLFQGADSTWENRAHFFGTVAQVMRRILVDHARTRAAAKRGGGGVARVRTTDPAEGNPDPVDEILIVDEGMAALEAVDPRRAQVVRLRFFAGLTNEETADVLGVSTPTVKREWRCARAWLYRHMVGTRPLNDADRPG